MRKAFISTALAAIVVATVAVHAQQNDPIASAQELVRAFFPELADHGHQMLVFWTDPFDNAWTTFGFLREFGLQVAETRKEFMKGETDDSAGSGLLDAYCEFEPSGQLHAMNLKGRANHYRERVALRSLVDHHSEWDDAKVIETMREQGALFGPEQRDAFTKTLPRMDSLTGPLGAPPRITSMDFVLRSKDFAGTSYAQLEWRVEFEVQVGRPRVAVRYEGSFEPHAGKLIALHVKPPAP